MKGPFPREQFGPKSEPVLSTGEVDGRTLIEIDGKGANALIISASAYVGAWALCVFQEKVDRIGKDIVMLQMNTISTIDNLEETDWDLMGQTDPDRILKSSCESDKHIAQVRYNALKKTLEKGLLHRLWR